MKKIYIGADHGGFKLKEEIKHWLIQQHFEVEDCGAHMFVDGDDYPDYAWIVAQKTAANHESLGILFCRSGQGVCIVANKARGVRAALAWNEHSAHAARNDDDANVLCVPSDYVTLDNAKALIHGFITTPFGKDERFARRVEKVKKIDRNL
jgi:ribose 5-phosphate isomerase B